MSPGEDFNPRSVDSMLSTILANQEKHGEMLRAFKDEFTDCKNQVGELQREKWYNRGVLASVAVMAPAAWDWIKNR